MEGSLQWPRFGFRGGGSWWLSLERSRRKFLHEGLGGPEAWGSGPFGLSRRLKPALYVRQSLRATSREDRDQDKERPETKNYNPSHVAPPFTVGIGVRPRTSPWRHGHRLPGRQQGPSRRETPGDATVCHLSSAARFPRDPPPSTPSHPEMHRRSDPLSTPVGRDSHVVPASVENSTDPRGPTRQRNAVPGEATMTRAPDVMASCSVPKRSAWAAAGEGSERVLRLERRVAALPPRHGQRREAPPLPAPVRPPAQVTRAHRVSAQLQAVGVPVAQHPAVLPWSLPSRPSALRARPVAVRG